MKTIAATLLAAALALAPGLAAPAEPEAAKETVRELVTAAHDALAGGQASEADLDRLVAAIEQGFAMNLWQRYLLDEVQANLSEDQRTTVEGLLPAFLADLYREQFARGLDEEPTIGEVEPVRRDLMVGVTFPRPDGKKLPTDMRVREIEGEHRIIDIMVGGASFLRLKRDEFAQIMREGGPDALIAHLRENSV